MSSTNHKQWQFFEYAPSEPRRDSGSEKNFRDLDINTGLIRELIQNSLDAAREESQAVEVKIRLTELDKNDCVPYLKGLERHYEASYKKPMKLDENEKVRFLVLEDFHTTGLEGGKAEDFFEKDNVRSESGSSSGGSHGIGKIVFYLASRIKVFFAFSVYQNDHVFKGCCDFKTHKLDEKEYREDGRLELCPEQDKNFIWALFSRDKEQNGLSIAIPLPDENLSVGNLAQPIIDEYYYPLINEKLIVNLTDRSIDADYILEQPKDKTRLISNYVTSKEPDLSIDIGEKYKNTNKDDFLTPEQIAQIASGLENNEDGLVIRFNFLVSREKAPDEAGWLDLLIAIKKGKEKEKGSADFDFWRENLLIKEAVSRGKSSAHYTAIVLIHGQSNALSHFLRKLENPSHTRWEYQNPSEDIKEEYQYIRPLVPFVRQLPKTVINYIMRSGIKLDSNFFSDFFPDTSAAGASSDQGQTSGDTDGSKTPDITSNPNFSFRENRKSNGFILSLSGTGKRNGIATLEVTVAYGTNKGNPFKNHDIQDFDLRENISIELRGGKQLDKQANRLLCQVNDKDKFKMTLSGFDPDRELKIDAKEAVE